MEPVPAESLVVEIEAKAAEMARHAGEILRGHFGGRLALMVGALAFISKKDFSAPVLAQVLSTGAYEALDP